MEFLPINILYSVLSVIREKLIPVITKVFAVFVTGLIQTGLFISTIRWFLFDDHNVTSVSLHHVLKQNVYMCFYIRDHCEYFPDDNHLNESLNLNSAVDIDGDTVMT